jgi:hypothetical protein
MSKLSLVTLAVLSALAVPASAQEHKDWCTDAHMQKMDGMVAKMSDAKMQEAAKMHLDMSKAEMQKNNVEGCVKHMEEAHKAIGM